MGSDNFIIIGGGPAGSFLAYLLTQAGASAKVYESLPKPAAKPCGMGVPKQIEKIFKIPDGLVMNEVRKYKVYLDGELFVESKEELWGWIVDKERMISYLLEGSEFINKKVNDRPDVLKELFPNAYVVISNGSYWNGASKERINALEVTLNLNERSFDENTIEIYFDTEMFGYYWIFPWGEKMLNIGVGGLMKFSDLKRKLLEFIKERKQLNVYPIHELERKIRGAQIIASGIDLNKVDILKNIFVVGEAAGAVFPLTGEGIRPSMITSKLLFDSIISGESYTKHLEVSDFYYANRLQAKVFEIMKAAPRYIRKMIMHSVPKEWFVKFGLGDFTREEIKKLKGLGGTFIELLSHSI
ncbi:MAG: hypothetical protein ACP5TH_01005 [Fervidicoccaceae archaeon]